MKEIDYIFKNIDVEKFLKLIKKRGKGYLTNEIYKCVKEPNKKIHDLLDHSVFSGIFFNKAKNLSLIYYGWIDSDNDRLDPNFKIICFHSKIDKKYRLITFEIGYGTGLQEYKLMKIFAKKPTKDQIKVELKNRINQLRKFSGHGTVVDGHVVDCQPYLWIFKGNDNHYKYFEEDDEDLYDVELALDRKK